ncbi:terpenoid synthase [Dendrothele bispora CBS 962.96]|uniref:Terpene synthase n=1 Tax=Dendrothele bispora (strain CBS 962.96) TaxID=1314807 RepID=A0A4S8MGY5_DENBC|nr:terpenoid synthase [Dendrothele bispora CBS 962.96]
MPSTLSKSQTPNQFILPDLLSSCLLKRGINPHYQEAAAESAAWLGSHNILSDKKRAEVISNHNELLVAHTYPYAEYEQFRTCCDFVNLLFIIDECSDEQNGQDAHATGKIFLDALRDADNQDSSPLAVMTKEFRARYIKLAGSQTSRRFFERCQSYIEAVAKEAQLREHGQVLDLESFIPLRRENSAVPLVFGLFEYALGIDLPQEVFDDSTFQEVFLTAVDLVCWSNDVYSYNMEYAKGIHGNNIVTVLMKTYNFDLQTSCDYVGLYFRKLMAQFEMGKIRLPSWSSEVDVQVARYVDALEYWIRGNLDWCFETNRYFGPHHHEVKSTRVVTLLHPTLVVDSDD